LMVVELLNLMHLPIQMVKKVKRNLPIRLDLSRFPTTSTSLRVIEER